MEKRIFTEFMFLLMVIEVVLSGAALAIPVSDDSQAMLYLEQFGYLPRSNINTRIGAPRNEQTFRKAVSEFQSFAGLEVTGVMNNETLHTMSLPRCGIRDRVEFGSNSRSKRYALQGSRWPIKDLTYRISKYPSNSRMTESDVNEEIRRAFNVWTDYTDLTFTQVKSGSVHIEIKFEKDEHGDEDPFDGKGGTLAHAYFPVYGGDAHFDDAEEWTLKSYRGTNLFQVAAHEFGHSLGLEHSNNVKSALMAPFYRGYDPQLQLDIDDITGIQRLYGKKTTIKNPTVPSYPSPSYPSPSYPESYDELCSDPKPDVIFNGANGETYAFKGSNYYKLTEQGVAPGYPQPISKTWIGLPGNIDAAFSYKNGKTYFFKGSKYWRYVGFHMDGDYPRDISEGFAGIPDKIDSALVWSGNGKIYFFKGNKFWRFDPASRPPVKSTYPKPISNWKGVPDNIDTAFQYTNELTYFFKNGVYYRFNDRTFSVDRADPAFPRSTAYWWFGCKSAPAGTVGVKGYLVEDDSVDDNFVDAAGPEDDDYENIRNNSFKFKQSTLLIWCCLLFAVLKIR